MSETSHRPDATSAPSSRSATARAVRPATLRSKRSNDPLAMPVGLDPRSSEGRRWRDLALAYSAQLGERMKCDGVGTQLRSLLWLSLELDRMTADRLTGKPVPLHTVLHCAQEVRALLTALGLNDAHNGNANNGALHDYLRNNNGDAR
jgi:hypothetical protein